MRKKDLKKILITVSLVTILVDKFIYYEQLR